MSDRGSFERYFFIEDYPDEEVQRGMFYRTMKLGTFIKDCEEKGYHIVGIRLDESNNGELLFIESK